MQKRKRVLIIMFTKKKNLLFMLSTFCDEKKVTIVNRCR